MGMDLVVSPDSDSHVTVLTVRGDVDALSAAALREGIETQLAAGRQTLVLDLEGVPFMDSTGLGVLVGGLRLTTMHQGTLTLCGVTPRVQRVMLITGLDDLFDLNATREQAIEAARTRVSQLAPTD